MSNPTIVSASLDDKELKQSIANLVANVKRGLHTMLTDTNSTVDAMEKKLKSLGNVKIDSGGSADGGSSRRTSAVEKETRARKELNMTLDQQAAALEKASGKKKGIEYTTIPSDVDKSLTYLVNTNKDVDAQMSAIIQKEQALIDAKQREAQITEQIASAQRAANSVRGVSAYDLGINPNVSAGRQRQIESTRAASKETEYLKQQVASLLEVEEREIKTANATSSSYAQLAQYLKHLQSAYQRLGADRIAKGEGTDIANEIQKTQRAMQKLQQTMSRPVSLKDAMGLSEKTLDDIAYKMRQLASYRGGLNIETQKNEIDQVNKKYAELQKNMNDVMKKNTDMIASNTALGRSWNYMKNRLAFYFTVGASTSFVKNLIEIRGQYELLDRSIGILIDSAQNGSQIFAELNAMAIKSPFTTMELGAAAKQLVAYDVAAKDVVDTTRRLADMAAAVGIPIERLTYALGQIKAYGYLNARDARMFANAGIPLVKELADYYTELEGRLVSTADVYDRIKKKAIDYSDVMSVVNKMTDEGGKFFDFQEKAADTLKVRIANLTLAWNNMLNEMGKDNQGILTEGLKVTKQIFESWRDINNMVIALGLTYGTIKAAQIAYYLWVMRTEKAVGAWSKIINAIDYAFNAKIANAINSLKTSLVGFFTNPAAMLAVAFTALSVALTKAYLDYRDLQAANEEFNKSVVKNAEENVKSIDKFFGDYKKQLESVGSLNSADQTKLWERVQEEIEKTTKNAEKYIEILNKIPEVSKRIEVGESVLEQSKRIQDELKYMAERGMFNVGGGFANDSAANDLQQYSDAVNELITKYGDLDNAKKEALKVNEITLESGETIRQYTGEYADFQRAQIEAEKELQNIVSTLDKVNMAEILGTGDMETQLANVRSFAIAWRDAFLATEKGSKISAEGQALLNSYIDKWIEQQARVNHLIKDENTAAVEANRTAWETFFKFLNTEERKRLDVAIKTNQLGSKSVQELWDNAAERMQEKATTSYNLIQQQIADLRNTPDIVINVVYRNNKEKLEKDQEEFEKKFIQPKNWGALSTDEYIKQEKANREKYGTLMRKQGEDTAEYEKRISDERKKNLELSEKNGKVIEENKNKTSEYSIAVTKLADKEKEAADDRLKVIKDVEDAGGYDFSTKSERAAANKAAKQAESELAKALKDELSTIEKVRSIYKDLTKEGMSHANAVERATKGWEETVNAINKVLQKNGLKKLNLSDFVGIENPREILKTLQSQLDSLVKRGASTSEIKVLQEKIQTVSVDADKYDLTKITKGLNSELDRLKDEYELAVSLDADPELGSMFADWMGIDMDDLPRTAQEYANQATNALNKALKERKADLELPNLLNITDDDLRELQNRVGTGGITQTYVDEITKAVKDVRGVFKKEKEDTSKEWNALIEKYGGLQAKLLKIYKDTVQEQASIVKQFGSDEQISQALDLVKKIQIFQDPADIARLQEQLAKIINDIIKNHPIALKTYQATQNEQKRDVSKANWEDFKESDLYTMTFEDMSRNSTRAIQLIIDKLNELKFKVKEDPASMKTLTKSLEEANKEFESRSSTTTIVNGIKEYIAATKEVTKAKEELTTANQSVTGSEIALKNAQAFGDANAIADATERLERARKKQKEATENAAKAENKLKAAQEKIKAGLNVLSSELQNIEQLLGAVASLFAAAGDEETAEAINAISKGFSVMTTVIMGVIAALILLEATNPWLLAIAAALSVIVGLVSFLSGNSNKKITQQVEESEKAVKRLENSYKKLEYAAEQAFGAATSGAQQALKANKELQLFELRRQLALEQSRSGKNYDEDKVLDLKGQIIDLENEIKDFTKNAVDDLLGISSHGDFFEDMISEMIDAFKSGEDAMKVFEEKWSKMIDNMIMKTIVSQVLQNWVNSLEKGANDILGKYTKYQSDAIANLNNSITDFSLMDAGDASKWIYENDRKAYEDILKQLRAEGMKENVSSMADWVYNSTWFDVASDSGLAKEIQDIYIANMQSRLDDLNNQLDKASLDATGELIEYYGQAGEDFKANYLGVILDKIKENWNFGQDSENKLSQLQQGIQSVSETTAGALEAYMNGVSQQVYLHSELLTQIRDAIVGTDSDIQLGVQGQILLQLQTSYQTQQAIQSILEGWSSPNGMSVRVEMV